MAELERPEVETSVGEPSPAAAGSMRQAVGRCFFDLLRGRWRLVALFFALSLTAAAFEGSTMALLALALHVVAADAGTGGLADEFGLVCRLTDAAVGGWEPR